MVYPNSEVYFLKNISAIDEDKIYEPNNDTRIARFLGGSYSALSGENPNINSKLSSYPNVAFICAKHSVVRDGVIQVGRNISDFAECNYFVYRNTIPRYGSNGSYTNLEPTSINRNYTATEDTPKQGTSTRWFYCFIRDVKYINPNVSEISYIVDSWHTFQDVLQYKEGVIEREHIKKSDDENSIYDYVYEDIKFDVNDFEYNGIEPSYFFGVEGNMISIPNNLVTKGQITDQRNYRLRKSVLVVSTKPFIGDTYTSLELNDVPHITAQYLFVDFGSNQSVSVYPSGITNFINTSDVQDDIDNVLMVLNIPNLFILPIYGSTYSLGGTISNFFRSTATDFSNPTAISIDNDNLTRAHFKTAFPSFVKNKKCLSGRYAGLKILGDNEVTIEGHLLGKLTSSGINLTNTLETVINYSISPNGGMTMTPVSLENVYSDYSNVSTNVMNNCYIKGVEQSIVSGNTFANTVSRQGATTAISGVAGAVSTALGIALMLTPEPTGATKIAGAGMLAGGLASSATAIATAASWDNLPNNSSGNFQNDMLAQGGNEFFRVVQFNLNFEALTRLDNYFTAFGYASKRHKKPAFISKPRNKFCYCKTADCNFYGNISTSDLMSIRDMFNRGVRMWYPENNGGNACFTNNMIGFNAQSVSTISNV